MGIGEVQWGNDHYSCPDNGDNGVTQNLMVHQHLPHCKCHNLHIPQFLHKHNHNKTIGSTKIHIPFKSRTLHPYPGCVSQQKIAFPPVETRGPSSVKDLLMSMAQELSRALLCRLEARGDGCETSPMVNTYIGYIYIYIYLHRVHIYIYCEW